MSFLLFAALVVVHFLFLTSRLLVPDLILNYPFMGGDSLDWVSTGLFYAGNDVRYTSRPPLLPVVIAGLSALSALDLLPVLIQVLTHVTSLGLFRLLCLDYSRSLAWIVSATWLMNGNWLRLSFDVMADVPAACLLTWAVISWRRSGSARPGYALTGLFGGLSAITQQLALLLPVVVMLTLLAFRRRDLASRPLLLGAVLFVAPTGLWLLWMRRALSLAGDDLSHWGLLRFHTDSIGHYLYQYVAFVGLPATVGILLGITSFLRRMRNEPWCFFVLSLQVVTGAFFVLLYDFNSLRFLAYVFPLSAVLLAEGLSRLRRPTTALSLALLTFVWALPFPSERADHTRILLWPAPLTYLSAASTARENGSRRIDPLDLEVLKHSTATLLRDTVYRLAPRPSPNTLESRGLLPESFQDDLWCLYYYAAPETADNYRAVTLGLGNLLLKRVHYLPISALEPRPSLDLSRLGVLDGTALYRAHIAGHASSWIVAARNASEADDALRNTSRKTRDAGPELARAERIAARIGQRPTAIFATSRGLKGFHTYLPFLIDTSFFFVIEPHRAPQARRMLGGGRPLTSIDGVTLVEHELFGLKWIVVE